MNAAPGEARQDHGSEPRVLVNVLGHFDVWHGDRDVTPPGGQPASLVQLLALHDGRMHCETLVAALWPDDAPWTGRQCLRNLLCRVRAHTDGLVARDRHRDLIRFAKPVRINLTEFLAATAKAIQLVGSDPQAAIAEGTRALILYRGPLLLDQPFAEWAHGSRVHAADRHRLLLDALAAASERLGDTFAAKLYEHQAARASEWRQPL